MKKRLLKFIALFIATILFGAQTQAANLVNTLNTDSEIDAMLDFDENEIYEAFDELNELIIFLDSDESVTIEVLSYQSTFNKDISKRIVQDNTVDEIYSTESQSSGFPPFLIGFLPAVGCGLIGGGLALLIYSSNHEDKHMRTQVLMGCISGALVSLMITMVLQNPVQ